MSETKTTAKKSTEMSDTLSNIELHKEAIKDGTPLALIKEKEIEINKKVMDAQKNADLKITKARERAEIIKQEAQEKAPAEAKKHYSEEIEKANNQAREIESAIPSETDKVEKTGLANFDEAVNKVMKIILP
jgi:vacuolar-type H+-ATPase subunit H